LGSVGTICTAPTAKLVLAPSWHCPQVSGKLAMQVENSGSLCNKMLWTVWQLVDVLMAHRTAPRGMHRFRIDFRVYEERADASVFEFYFEVRFAVAEKAVFIFLGMGWSSGEKTRGQENANSHAEPRVVQDVFLFPGLSAVSERGGWSRLFAKPAA